MEANLPTLKTTIVVGAFVVAYVLHILRKTVRDGLDFYEFLLLSSVAIVPGVFTFFPRWTAALSAAIGVAFPFVVMFGSLLAITFVFLHRLTVQVHALERRSRRLVQENGLLRREIEEIRGSAP